MTMNRITLPFAALFFAALPSLAAPARAARPPPGDCRECHETWDLLPDKHDPVQGHALSDCLACHKPQTEAKQDPFSALLHRAHQAPSIECTTCHTFAKGKLGLLGSKVVLGKFEDGGALVRRMTGSWAGSSFLDERHAKANVGCAGCHAGALPEIGADVERARCLTCHGPEEKLIAKAAPAVHADRNPHKSHLGEIDCTVCHHAHKASENYCLGCHPKFRMQLPEGPRLAVAPTEEAPSTLSGMEAAAGSATSTPAHATSTAPAAAPAPGPAPIPAPAPDPVPGLERHPPFAE
jgi:Cytochrome c3